MGEQRHGLKMNSPFLLSGPSPLLLGVIPDNGIDDKAPVPLKLRAKSAQEFQNIRFKRHTGGNLGWGHEVG